MSNLRHIGKQLRAIRPGWKARAYTSRTRRYAGKLLTIFEYEKPFGVSDTEEQSYRVEFQAVLTKNGIAVLEVDDVPVAKLVPE